MTEELRAILRIKNTDLNGYKSVGSQLRNIKGVSFMFSNAICKVTAIPFNKKSGSLTAEEIQKIEIVLKTPIEFGIPIWLLNRQKDPETNDNLHLLGTDLKFVQSNDIKLMKKVKSYKGIRHHAGLPVRGQRTKSNFRKNKGGTGRKKKR